MGDVVRVQVNVPKLTVNPKELVNFMLGRLEEMDYEATVKSYKFQDKIDKKAGGKVPGEITQVQFMINAFKDIDDYTRFVVDIEFTNDNVKVLKEREKTIISGESKIIFTSKAETDYNKRWRSNPFLYFLRNIYEKYMYNLRLVELEDKAEEELFDLAESVKSKLKVK